MALTQRLDSLKKRHAQLDAILHEEEIRPAPDIVRVHQLKREKLTIKDEVARIYDERHEQQDAA